MDVDWDMLDYVDEGAVSTPLKMKRKVDEPTSTEKKKESSGKPKRRSQQRQRDISERFLNENQKFFAQTFPMIPEAMLQNASDMKREGVKVWQEKTWVGWENGKLGCIPCREAAARDGTDSPHMCI
jgi:hypothetical protein